MVEIGERYRHFKGKEYEIVVVGWDSDSLKSVVVYRGDYSDKEFGENPVWVRELEDFVGVKVFENGKKVKRFELIGGSKMKIKIKKLREDAVVPKYANSGDAGMDVVAVSKGVTDKFIEYGTGLAFEIPEGHVMLIFPRSSVSKKDLVLANSVGVLDSGYRGELFIRFQVFGDDDYEVGERVAQVVILPYPSVEFVEGAELEKSERGKGGFGSTGV